MSKDDDRAVEHTISQEVKNTLKEIAETYIKHLLEYIDGYFFNGKNPSNVNTALPSWILLARDSFDFKMKKERKAREESFDKLMKTLIQPFTEGEVNVAKFQYSMLLSHAETLLEEDSDCQQSLKSLIYRICTSSKLYTGCELAISVMLLNLGSSTSECGMESLISSLKDNNSVDRPITLPQLHKELLIRKNGPHPLHATTTKFLHDALYRHFGSGPAKWRFITGTYAAVDISQVITRHIRDAPPPKMTF